MEPKQLCPSVYSACTLVDDRGKPAVNDSSYSYRMRAGILFGEASPAVICDSIRDDDLPACRYDSDSHWTTGGKLNVHTGVDKRLCMYTIMHT